MNKLFIFFGLVFSTNFALGNLDPKMFGGPKTKNIDSYTLRNTDGSVLKACRELDRTGDLKKLSRGTQDHCKDVVRKNKK